MEEAFYLSFDRLRMMMMMMVMMMMMMMMYYQDLPPPIARQPPVGHGLLILEISRSHTTLDIDQHKAHKIITMNRTLLGRHRIRVIYVIKVNVKVKVKLQQYLYSPAEALSVLGE